MSWQAKTPEQSLTDGKHPLGGSYLFLARSPPPRDGLRNGEELPRPAGRRGSQSQGDQVTRPSSRAGPWARRTGCRDCASSFRGRLLPAGNRPQDSGWRHDSVPSLFKEGKRGRSVRCASLLAREITL